MSASAHGLAHRLRSLADELVELQAIVVPEETPEAALVAMREAHGSLLDARRAIERNLAGDVPRGEWPVTWPRLTDDLPAPTHSPGDFAEQFRGHDRRRKGRG